VSYLPLFFFLFSFLYTHVHALRQACQARSAECDARLSLFSSTDPSFVVQFLDTQKEIDNFLCFLVTVRGVFRLQFFFGFIFRPRFFSLHFWLSFRCVFGRMFSFRAKLQ